jgi:hypothetical protein
MRIIFGMALALVASLAYPQQTPHKSQPNPDFRINPAKPFVYIEFSRVGPRKPFRRGEPESGLWLRLVNNCRLPIEVTKWGSDADPEVEHEVVYDEPYMVRVTPDGKQHPEHRPRSEMPHGYSFLDVVDSLVVLPGNELEFSVPVNHVTADWHIELPFHFKFSHDLSAEPILHTAFSLSQVPEAQLHHFDSAHR